VGGISNGPATLLACDGVYHKYALLDSAIFAADPIYPCGAAMSVVPETVQLGSPRRKLLARATRCVPIVRSARIKDR